MQGGKRRQPAVHSCRQLRARSWRVQQLKSGSCSVTQVRSKSGLRQGPAGSATGSIAVQWTVPGLHPGRLHQQALQHCAWRGTLNPYPTLALMHVCRAQLLDPSGCFERSLFGSMLASQMPCLRPKRLWGSCGALLDLFRYSKGSIPASYHLSIFT